MCDQCKPIATQLGLKLELKTGWAQGTLLNRENLVHCSMVKPEVIKAAGGFDPSKSSEFVTDAKNNHGDWRWNRFLFAFLYKEGNFPPKGAKFFGFGDGGYIYLLSLPAGRAFMTMGGTIMDNREVGIPDRVVLSEITGVFKYHGPSKAPKEQLEPIQWK